MHALFARSAIVIPYTNFSQLTTQLQKHGVNKAHFTNGTYVYAADKIVPTILAGFQFAIDQDPADGAALIIAINSDISMRGIMDRKMKAGTASRDDKESVEQQFVRAAKVINPLALQFPHHKTVAIFYDQETPAALYEHLRNSAVSMVGADGVTRANPSLFSWWDGTSPDDGRIEGEHCFHRVFGFPLPNDEGPLCADNTGKERRPDTKSEVFDLLTVIGLHGQPYITHDNKLLTPIRHPSLLCHAPEGAKVTLGG